MAGQSKLRNHLRPQHAGNIGCRGDAAAGSDFFRDAASAHDFAPLQHQHREPGARQIRRRGEPVVAPADDDGIVDGLRAWHHRC